MQAHLVRAVLVPAALALTAAACARTHAAPPAARAALQERPPADTVLFTGQVTDSKSKQAIEGAQLRIAGTSRGILSQPSGDFRLAVASAEVRGRTLTIQIRRIGYASQERQVDIAGDSVVRLDFKLVRATTILREMAVTGER